MVWSFVSILKWVLSFENLYTKFVFVKCLFVVHFGVKITTPSTETSSRQGMHIKLVFWWCYYCCFSLFVFGQKLMWLLHRIVSSYNKDIKDLGSYFFLLNLCCYITVVIYHSHFYDILYSFMYFGNNHHEIYCLYTWNLIRKRKHRIKYFLIVISGFYSPYFSLLRFTLIIHLLNFIM